MAYYEGQTLKSLIESELLPLDHAMDTAIQIAEGLSCAHECSVVHRDIKPANIIVTNRNMVKILDFGLAKLTGQSRLTQEGTTLGTVAYMSPEQAQGENIDHRTDIWSFGVVLYELLTGQLPFTGEYDQAVIYSIVNKDLEPLNFIHSETPLALQDIVCKALEKNTAERYQDAEEMLSDLKSLSANSEFLHPIPKQASWKILRKKRQLLSGIIILALILLFALQAFLVDSDNAININSIAILPLKNYTDDPKQEYFADG